MKITRHILLLLALGAVSILPACGQAAPVQGTPAASPEATEPAEPAAAATEAPAALPDCPLALPGPGDWPVFICDQFEGGTGHFPNEEQDNPYARYNARVSDGEAFTIDYTAKAFAQFQRKALTWFDIGQAQDFALSLTGSMDSGFQDVGWGIGFRGSQDRESFFLLSIMNDGTYAFEIYENNGWISLVSRRVFSGILPGGENTLKVVAEGRNFKFQINGQPVEGFNGGLLEGMDVFLVVMAKEGASATFTFDDLVMQI
jgi:hypothetical protein